jgi:hypothetical protein
MTFHTSFERCLRRSSVCSGIGRIFYLDRLPCQLHSEEVHAKPECFDYVHTENLTKKSKTN